MASLCTKFPECAHPLLVGVPDDNTIDSLCVDLVIMITHTMSNYFLRSAATLESIKMTKSWMLRCLLEIN